MAGHRITNVGRSRSESDVPNVAELRDNALLVDPSGVHIAHSSILATHGVQSKTKATAPNDLVPLHQMQALLSGAANAVLLTGDQNVHGVKMFDGLAVNSNFFVMSNGNTNINVDLTKGQTVGLSSFNRLVNATADFGVYGFLRDTVHLTPVPPGFVSVFFNETTFTMTLFNAGPLGLITGWLRTASGGPILVRGGAAVIMIYSAFFDRWIPLSVSP